LSSTDADADADAKFKVQWDGLLCLAAKGR